MSSSLRSPLPRCPQFLVVIPLTFASALILGAIVAPPDAVTAVAVGRKLGLPKRVMSILTGESLINDAAALALYSVAVAQVAGTHTFIEDPVLLFAYSAVLGPLVGAALGYVRLWIRRRLANPALETVQGLMVPFAAFILAQEMNASGVLAVVVAGFFVGSGTVDAGYQTRLQERYVWKSVDVLLEAFVFAYIGLNLRFVLEDLNDPTDEHDSLILVAVSSVVVLLVVLVIRPLWVFAMFGRGLLSRQVERRLSVPIPEARTLRAEVFAALYREVLSAQRAALIRESDAGGIDEEAVRAMLDRLDLQEAGVSARLESRF